MCACLLVYICVCARFTARSSVASTARSSKLVSLHRRSLGCEDRELVLFEPSYTRLLVSNGVEY